MWSSKTCSIRASSTVHRIVFDMESVYEIDTQGADTLGRLVRDLSERASRSCWRHRTPRSEICSSGSRSQTISGLTVCSTLSRQPSRPATSEPIATRSLDTQA